MAGDFEHAVVAEDAWFRQLASDYDVLPPGPTGSERQNERPAREWSDDELSACLLAYLEMLGKQEAKVGFSKADYRRTLLANELSRRTDGSIEYRMQNISAFLAEQGKPTVDGYLPAKNVGRGVMERLQRIYDEFGDIELTDFAPTEDPSILSQRAAKLSRLTGQYTPVGNKNPQRSSAVQNQFIRDPLVVEAVLKFADGRCECCGCEAPFRRDDDTLAEAGPSAHGIMSWLGHQTLKEAQHYTEEADRWRAVMGTNEVRKLQPNPRQGATSKK